MDEPTLEQTDLRFRNDDGTEVTATWRQLINVDDTQAVDTVYRVRIVVKETAGFAGNNANFQLQYNHNGGGWNDATELSIVINANAPSGLVDNSDTTQQLTSPDTFVGPTNDGQEESNGGVGGPDCDFAGNDSAELEVAYSIISGDVSAADTIDFRLLWEGGSIVYTRASLRVTVAGAPAAVSPVIPQRRADVHEDPASRDHVVQPQFSYIHPSIPANPVIPIRTGRLEPHQAVQLDQILARYYNVLPAPPAPGVHLPQLIRTAIEAFGPEVLYEILAEIRRIGPIPPAFQILPPVAAPVVAEQPITVPPRVGAVLGFTVGVAPASAVILTIQGRIEIDPDPDIVAAAIATRFPFAWHVPAGDFPASPVVPYRQARIEQDADPAAAAVTESRRPYPVHVPEADFPASPVLPFRVVPIDVPPGAVPQPFFMPVVQAPAAPAPAQLVIPWLILRPEQLADPTIEPRYMPVIVNTVPPAPSQHVPGMRTPRIEEPLLFEVRPEFFKVIRNSMTAAAGLTLAQYYVSTFQPDLDADQLPDMFAAVPKFLPVIQPVPDPPAGPAVPVILFRQAARYPQEITLDVLPIFLPVIQGPITLPGPGEIIVPYRTTPVHQIVPDDVRGDWVGAPVSRSYYPLISYVVLYQDYRVPVFFDPTLYDPVATLQLDATFRTTVAGLKAIVRIVDKTTGRAVATLVTDSDTLTRVVSDTFTLADADLYQIEVGVPSGGGVEIARAEVTGVQNL